MNTTRPKVTPRSFGLLGGILLVLLESSDARAAGQWTHAASACAVDEASISKYDVNAARLRLKTGKTGTIVARCNVTDVGFTNGSQKFFQVFYRDTDGTDTGDQVVVSLYKVAANGGVTLIATIDSNVCPPWTSCDETGDQEVGRWLDVDFDFSHHAYFVEIKVKRSVAAAEHDPTISMVLLVE